jgi:hypothetical protein
MSLLNRGPKSILNNDLRSNTITSKQTKYKSQEDAFDLRCKNKTARAAISIQRDSYGGRIAYGNRHITDCFYELVSGFQAGP